MERSVCVLYTAVVRRSFLLAITLASPACKTNAPAATAETVERTATPESGEGALPSTLDAARSASIMVRFGQGGCSATKVGRSLVLTAAHCYVGYSGTEMLGAPVMERNGVPHPLRVAEMGAFEPSKGHVQDWLLLEATDDVLDGIAVAPLASATQMQELRNIGHGLDDRTIPVWGLTYPMPSERKPPRTPMTGGPFAGRGFVKSGRAYRQATVLAISSGRIYDDRAEGAPPKPPADFEAQWSTHPDLTILREHHERYQADGDPIVHHSADYSNGSSGGGFFAEDTGALVGIVPFGASVASRRDEYAGFGTMYGVDAICRASKILACSRSENE